MPKSILVLDLTEKDFISNPTIETQLAELIKKVPKDAGSDIRVKVEFAQSAFIKIKELYNGFRKSFKDGLFSIIDFFIGFLDIISELAKVISLSLRLFGNIYAGIVLTSVIFTGMAYILPSVWVGMGLLFAIVQAVVFSSLITAYYVLAVKLKSEDDV